MISEINEEIKLLPGIITDAIWKVSNRKIEKLLIEILYFELKPSRFSLSKIFEAHKKLSDGWAFDDVELAKMAKYYS